MRELAQAIGGAKPRAHAEVVHRQHVAAAEMENEQHFDRPAADAAHLGQPLDDRLIVERLQGLPVRHHTVERFGRQVLESGDLRKGETGGAQLRLGGRQHLLRGGEYAFPAGGDEASEDGIGRGAVELLMRDRAGERLKRLAHFIGREPTGTGGADHAGEDGIALGEVAQDLPAHF